MKTSSLVVVLSLLSGPLMAAEAGPQDAVKNAARALADKSGYSWKTTVESAGGGGAGGGQARGRMGPTEGKTEKGGYTCLVMTRGENTVEAVLKGDKGAIKGEEGWTTLAEAAEASGGGQGGGPGRWTARTLQSFKAPAAQAEELAGKAEGLKQEGDAVVGRLSEEGAKGLMTFGGRAGANAPSVQNAKGTVKFWIKDGVLAKYEFHVEGSISRDGNEMQINRKTTVEIKDVGATKVTVPEDAKKKLS